MKLPSKNKVLPPAPPTTEKWMFKPIERPAFTDSLRFPDDITKLSSSNVSALHGNYVSLYAYAVSELSLASVQALRIRSEMHVRRNNVSRTGQTYGKKKHAIDIEVRNDKALEDLQLKVDVVEQKIKQLEAFVTIFDRYASTLSREITRRTSEMTRT